MDVLPDFWAFFEIGNCTTFGLSLTKVFESVIFFFFFFFYNFYLHFFFTLVQTAVLFTLQDKLLKRICL